MFNHDELIELQTLQWVLTLVDISLPDSYSQPCLDDAVDKIKFKIDDLTKRLWKCDKVEDGTNPSTR